MLRSVDSSLFQQAAQELEARVAPGIASETLVHRLDGLLGRLLRSERSPLVVVTSSLVRSVFEVPFGLTEPVPTSLHVLRPGQY